MADETNIAKYSSLRIGAFFFWILGGFGKRYDYFLSERFEKKNIITGYLINLIFLAIFIYIIFLKIET